MPDQFGKILNVGLIGYRFMGKAHSNAWLQAPHFFDLPAHPVLHTICGRSAEKTREVADRWGWKHAVTDYRELTASPEIDLIDISTPNNAHWEQALAAAEAGKAIACEKPLARTLSEARQMAAAVKKARVPNFVWFNYRRVPALALARQLIEQGRIGKVYHVRALYLQSWLKNPNMPLIWRLSEKEAGSGPLGDLGAHSIDLIRHLTGDEFNEVCGLAHTFIKERPVGEMVEGLTARTRAGRKMLRARVTVDDAVFFLARLKSGAIGTFEATRFATGHHNGNSFEINGEKGALRFNFEDFSYLDFFDDTLPPSEKGWRRISVTTGHDPYSGHYWPAGHVIGYEHTFINTVADIVNRLAGKTREFHADFEDGLRCQEVLEAVLTSHRRRDWVAIKEV